VGSSKKASISTHHAGFSSRYSRKLLNEVEYKAFHVILYQGNAMTMFLLMTVFFLHLESISE
jgi:hypothetical protein